MTARAMGHRPGLGTLGCSFVLSFSEATEKGEPALSLLRNDPETTAGHEHLLAIVGELQRTDDILILSPPPSLRLGPMLGSNS